MYTHIYVIYIVMYIYNTENTNPALHDNLDGWDGEGGGMRVHPDTIIPSPVSQGPTLTLNCGIHNISLHSFLFMPIFFTSLLAS